MDITMKIRFFKRLIFYFLLLMVLSLPSCSDIINQSNSLVKIRYLSTNYFSIEGKDFINAGLVVGDGTQILTVFNYEYGTPSDVIITVNGGKEYKGYVQRIDPRTSATLIKLNNGKLPVAKIGDPEKLKPGQKVMINGWSDSQENLIKTPAIVADFATAPPLCMNIQLSPEVSTSPTLGADYASTMSIPDGTGNVVTNEKNECVGFIGTYYEYLIVKGWLPVDAIPPVVKIDDALELIASDVDTQPWRDGPVLTLYTSTDSGGFIENKGYYSGGLLSWTGEQKLPLSNNSAILYPYYELSDTLRKLAESLDAPIPSYELLSNFMDMISLPKNNLVGEWLTATYRNSIDLKGINGKVLAQAKWIGIQWNRSTDKPDRLVYGYITYRPGEVTYKVEGGYFLKSDITTLVESIQNALSIHSGNNK